MKKSIIICLLSVVFFNCCMAQDNALPLQITTTINILPLGVGIVKEFPITDKSTIKAEILGLVSFGTETDDNQKIQSSVFGILNGNLNYRYYFKLKKTNSAGTKPLINSGSYFFGRVSSVFLLFETNDQVDLYIGSNAVTVGIGWGMQRMFQNRFVFGFGVGQGVNLSDMETTLMGELTLGIRLEQKK